MGTAVVSDGRRLHGPGNGNGENGHVDDVHGSRTNEPANESTTRANWRLCCRRSCALWTPPKKAA